MNNKMKDIIKFSHIKYILLSISLLLLWSCEKKANFTMDLSHFFHIDKNVTYLYNIVDTHEVNGKKEPFMPDRYMEKHLASAGNNCINIESYVLFNSKDIERMDTRMKAEVKNNKLRTIDEKYCVKGNTITVNGEVLVDLENEWIRQVESQSPKGTMIKEYTVPCRVVDISKKSLLYKKRKIIHTQCNGEPFGKVDWFLAENIGLYRYVMETEYPEFKSKSKNEIILMKEVKK